MNQDKVNFPQPESKAVKVATLISVIATTIFYLLCGCVTISTPTTIVTPLKIKRFRIVWRTSFVIMTTLISILFPFFNDIKIHFFQNSKAKIPLLQCVLKCYYSC
ncbi:hypothetical protein KIW84_056691 [Lathyrus oleraceus]|uniref:Uncharacterized protein n=1 Tax=Pisum sativum TaxID=3888 RepID=A0A9D5ALG9_PEA|nr:hypothetical protein KIW84_056691 [Pisum sativum]